VSCTGTGTGNYDVAHTYDNCHNIQYHALMHDTGEDNDMHTVIVLNKNFTVFAISCFNTAYTFHMSTPSEKIIQSFRFEKVLSNGN